MCVRTFFFKTKRGRLRMGAPFHLISLALPHIHRLSSYTIRSITMIMGFGRLHYCCCLSEASLVIPLSILLPPSLLSVSWFHSEASVKDWGDLSGSWQLLPSAIWTAEFYFGRRTAWKANLSFWGFCFNSCSTVAPSEAYLYRWRLCLWPFMRVILRR